MANKKQEKLLVEAMKNLLDQDDLGRVSVDDQKEHVHNTQFQWEDILRDFALAVKKSEFFDSLNSAFYAVHSYKWIDDDKFEIAMSDILKSQGIPENEIELAIDGLEKVRKQYLKDKGNESAAGWHENLDDIKNVTQNPTNDGVSDFSKETMSGKNKPFSGAEPDDVRPQKI